MKLIMEGWRGFVAEEQIKEPLLKNCRYITEVLGIDIPLNESRPIPTKVTELALDRYDEMNRWWAPLNEGVGDWWARAKELGKGAWSLLKLLKSLVTGGAGPLRTYSKAIGRKGIGDIKQKIDNFMNIIIEKKDAWNIPAIANLAKKAKDHISTAYKKVQSVSGWMGAIAKTSLALGLRWVWSKIEGLYGHAVEFYKKESGVEDAISNNPLQKFIDKAEEVIKGFAVGVAQKMAKMIGMAWGDVTAWYSAAVKVFGGAAFVLDSLKSTLSFAKSRGIAEEEAIT
tara:strand:+ start:148 stop:999 length:852 start_codon:yes stop_codon:yes gene_type:complete